MVNNRNFDRLSVRYILPQNAANYTAAISSGNFLVKRDRRYNKITYHPLIVRRTGQTSGTAIGNTSFRVKRDRNLHDVRTTTSITFNL